MTNHVGLDYTSSFVVVEIFKTVTYCPYIHIVNCQNYDDHDDFLIIIIMILD